MSTQKTASFRTLLGLATLLLAVVAQAVQGDEEPCVPVIEGPLPAELQAAAQPPRHLYYAATNGSVYSIDLYDLTTGPTVDRTHFAGWNVGAARSIAVVSRPRPLLYYAATDNAIHSIYVDSLTSGPFVPATTFTAAVGAGRGLAVHQLAHLVFAAKANGAVIVVAPADKALPAEIPAAKFTGGNVGAARQLAVDPLADLLYYSVTDGSIASIDLRSPTLGPGLAIPRSCFLGANPGAGRRIAIDVETGLLWYAVTDGRVASIDPWTLLEGDTLASTLFTGAAVGAARQITVESTSPLIFADGFESGDTTAWSWVRP